MEEATRTEPSFCRICNAMCGIVVTLAGDRVLQVRGDPEHPLSRGYTCPKGRALPQLHHDAARLDRPAIRGADVPWEALLDDLAERISTTVADVGADGVAMYLASGSAFDAAGRRAAERFLRALGSAQKYTATTIDTPCKPLVAELIGGWSGLTPIWDHERSTLLVLIGSNPVVSHGHSNAIPDPVRRLREHRARGGELWVVDPRRTETAQLADRHLRPTPGTDWLVLAHVVRALLQSARDRDEDALGARATGIEELARALAPLTPDVVSASTGLAHDELDDLVAAVRRHGRVSALTGTGTSMSSTANLTEWMLWALHIVTDSYDRPGGMWFNPGFLGQLDRRRIPSSDGVPGAGPPSRPELPRRFGEWPCAGLISEIEAGHVRDLIVVGGNPVTAFPDADRTRAALRSLDTLAVVDIVATETTAIATHVLPAAGSLERADVTWLMDGYQLAVATQYTPALVAPAADRRPVWRMFAELGERLGLDVLGRGLTAGTATDDALLQPLAAASREGAEAVFAARHGTVHSGAVFGWISSILPDGGWRLAPPPLLRQLADVVARPPAASDPGGFSLIAHRQLRTMNSQLRSLATATVRVHPTAADALGGDGTEVEIRSAHGVSHGIVHGDENVPPGAVTMPHGWSAADVSALTAADADIDALTGMVTQSAIPVQIAPVRSDG